MAERVAAIDIPLDPKAIGPGAASRQTAQAQGLRPAKFSPVHVAVLTPHQMWDARDVLSRGGSLALAEDKSEDGLRGAVTRMAEPAVEPALRAAAPVVARAMVEQAVARSEPPKLRPAVVGAGPRAEGRMVQLGAYSSRAGAQAAAANSIVAQKYALCVPSVLRGCEQLRRGNAHGQRSTHRHGISNITHCIKIRFAFPPYACPPHTLPCH